MDCIYLPLTISSVCSAKEMRKIVQQTVLAHVVRHSRPERTFEWLMS